jgi:predicted nucleic acid-binding protein
LIVADTGGVLALIDRDDRHHRTIRGLYDAAPSAWVLPWAVLPEIDDLLMAQVGARVEKAFLADLAEGAFAVEWGHEANLARARDICRRHRALELGLVDAVVMAVAERLAAEVIVTLDLGHFGAVTLRGRPRLLPRDLA